MNLTIASVKAFFDVHLPLAEAVLAHREQAAAVRAKVDAYTWPILAELGLKDDEDEAIEDPKNLYLCEDEDGCNAFYAACDEAHKAHGFELPGPGYCPALVAEDATIKAENALLKAATDHFDFGFDRICKLELRAKALDLFTNLPDEGVRKRRKQCRRFTM